VDLLHKLGDSIQQGEPLYRVHAAYPSDLEFAAQLCRKASGYTLGQAHEVPHVFVEF
jgi:thymidine phosphorylase